jgi:hypothetical protein
VEQLYTEELLRAAFAHWELLRIESYERELDDGEGHKGRSAVIDMIAARKANVTSSTQLHRRSSERDQHLQLTGR